MKADWRAMHIPQGCKIVGTLPWYRAERRLTFDIKGCRQISTGLHRCRHAQLYGFSIALQTQSPYEALRKTRKSVSKRCATEETCTDIAMPDEQPRSVGDWHLSQVRSNASHSKSDFMRPEAAFNHSLVQCKQAGREHCCRLLLPLRMQGLAAYPSSSSPFQI